MAREGAGSLDGWVIEPEYIACALMALLFLYTYQGTAAPSERTVSFRVCILCAIGSTVVNVAGVYLLVDAARIPLWLNYLVQSLYFVMMQLVPLAICRYLFGIVYERAGARPRYRAAVSAIWIVFTLYLAAVAVNLKTGMIFRFDAGRSYVRGPLNKLPYIALAADAAVSVVCFLRNREYVGEDVGRALICVPPVALAVAAFQLVSPNTMLSGTTMALVLIMLFINLQQCRASADPLTGLADRAAFYRTLDAWCRGGKPFDVVVVCLRNLKSINTRYGQRGGDAVIWAVSRYVSEVGKGGVCCRFTGTEFACVLSRTPGHAAEYAARLQARFAEPWQTGGFFCYVDACVLGLECPKYAAGTSEIIETIEYAVRLLKDGKESSPLIFDERLQIAFRRRSFLRGYLNKSVADNRFFCVYQPFYSFSSRGFTGAEALLRLRGPDGKLISPAEFIPVAEDTGLVVQLDWMVLDMVCAFLAAHGELRGQAISVNFSPQQFSDPAVDRKVFGILTRRGVDPAQLKIEITERMLVEDPGRARSTMERLIRGGIGFFLDDFGVGYSSLSSVLALPFECVKLDQSLIGSVESSEQVRGMLEYFISGLRMTGARILAEGVENERQLEILRGMGVDFVQGYLLARPADGDAYAALAAPRAPAPEA